LEEFLLPNLIAEQNQGDNSQSPTKITQVRWIL